MVSRTSSPIEAPLAFAGAFVETKRYASSIEPTSEATWLFPSTSPVGEQCWLPTERVEDAPSAIEELLANRPHTGVQARSLAAPWTSSKLKIADELWIARNFYWERIRVLERNWISAGKKVSPEIVREISAARDAVRIDIRNRFVASGRMAKAYDFARDSLRSLTSSPSSSKTVQSKLEAAIASGSEEQLRAFVAKAFKTNTVVDGAVVIARSGSTVLKLLGVGATIVIAVDVPLSLYMLDTAQTDKERDEALRSFANATAATTVTALCIVMGVGTGGVGFLACGVAPVLAGLYAGDAALWVKSQIR